MLSGSTVSLVMPCRNEAKHLAQMVADIPDFYDEIICVSNKSSDDTVEVGREIERSNPRFEMLVDDRVASGIGYGFANAHKYLGPRFGEVRIRQGIRFGETKQSYLKTGFGHLKWIFKNRFIQRKGIQPAD